MALKATLDHPQMLVLEYRPWLPLAGLGLVAVALGIAGIALLALPPQQNTHIAGAGLCAAGALALYFALRYVTFRRITARRDDNRLTIRERNALGTRIRHADLDRIADVELEEWTYKVGRPDAAHHTTEKTGYRPVLKLNNGESISLYEVYARTPADSRAVETLRTWLGLTPK